MIRELTENYQPLKVLHRDKQIKSIEKVFENFKKMGVASNLLIFGVTGSGKTTTIKKIIKENNCNVFSSGATTNTAFKTFRAIFDLNCKTTERLINESINKLKQNPRIIIIDEVNKIIDPTNLFNTLNIIYRETNCPVIIITNKRTIYNDIPEDALKTLFFERVDFKSYNALELYDIIKGRLEGIEQEIPEIPEATLKKICAIGGKDSSARTVLTMTLRCILSNDFSETFIDKIKNDLKIDEWRDFLNGLKTSEKEFLKNLLELQLKQKTIFPSDLSSMMKDFTPPRISQLISSFENYGIIESKYKNKGRAGGRLREIKFVSQEVFDTLDEMF